MPRPVACSSCRRRYNLLRSPLIVLDCSSCRRRCDLHRSSLIALDCSSCRRRCAPPAQRHACNQWIAMECDGLRWIASLIRWAPPAVPSRHACSAPPLPPPAEAGVRMPCTAGRSRCMRTSASERCSTCAPRTRQPRCDLPCLPLIALDCSTCAPRTGQQACRCVLAGWPSNWHADCLPHQSECLPHQADCLPHQVARSTARTAEGIAKDAQSAASREVDVMKGKLHTDETHHAPLMASLIASLIASLLRQVAHGREATLRTSRRGERALSLSSGRACKCSPRRPPPSFAGERPNCRARGREAPSGEPDCVLIAF
jgi:hypothetical protein